MEKIVLIPQSNLILSLSPTLEYIQFIFHHTNEKTNNHEFNNKLINNNIEHAQLIENPLETILFFGIPLKDLDQALYVPTTLLDGTFQSKKNKMSTILFDENDESNKIKLEQDEDVIMSDSNQIVQTHISLDPNPAITFNCNQLGVYTEISLYHSGKAPVEVSFKKYGITKYSFVKNSIFSNVNYIDQTLKQKNNNLTNNNTSMNNSHSNFELNSNRECILVIGGESSGKTSFCKFWTGIHYKEQWAVCDLNPRCNMISLPGTMAIGLQKGTPNTWSSFQDPWIWFYGHTTPFARPAEYCSILEAIGEKIINLNMNTIIKMPTIMGNTTIKIASIIIDSMNVTSIVLLGEQKSLQDAISKKYPNLNFFKLNTIPEECFSKGNKWRTNFKKRCLKEYFCGRCFEYIPKFLTPEKKKLKLCRVNSIALNQDNIPFKERYLQIISTQRVVANRDMMSLLVGISNAKKMSDIPISTVKGFIIIHSFFSSRVRILAPINQWYNNEIGVVGSVAYISSMMEELEEAMKS